MSSKFKAVLFDLDGTLADTLADLANATNHALTQLGCPTHPVEAYRDFVGDGAKVLCQRVLPRDKQALAEEALKLMRAHYEAHCFDLTRLYPGIPELVSALAERGCRLAVLSNKPDNFTKQMIAHYFKSAGGASARRQVCGQETEQQIGARRRLPHSLQRRIGPFDLVQGQLSNLPLKPDPTAALQIAKELGIPPAEWLYLGDTNTDMRTARAAGMHAVGVLWGFRDRQELVESGARTVVARPADVLKLL